MRTAAQLDGLPLHRSTLALAPDALVLTGRTRLLESVCHRLSLHEVTRVETFDAEEPVNLRVWIAADAWHLRVSGPVVWRFAIEDALRRLGRVLPRVGAFREPGARPGPTPGGADRFPRAPADAATPPRHAPPQPGPVPPGTPAPQVGAAPQVGDVVPLRLTVELPGGVEVEVRLLGEIERVGAPAPRAAALADPASLSRGDGQARDFPRLRVHL